MKLKKSAGAQKKAKAPSAKEKQIEFTLFLFFAMRRTGGPVSEPWQSCPSSPVPAVLSL
jgi:hypothetical protein